MFISKVFLFIFVCLFSVCGSSVSRTENTNQIQQTEIDKLTLTMERTGCYGTCPIYVLNVESDGKVKFEGKGYTKTIGKAEGNLSKQQIDALIAEIKQADFFSLKNSYTDDSDNCPNDVVMDEATVMLTIQLNEKSKTVRHYLGCVLSEKSATSNGSKSSNIPVKDYRDFTKRIFPQQLYILENKIDEIVETKRWVGELN